MYWDKYKHSILAWKMRRKQGQNSWGKGCFSLENFKNSHKVKWQGKKLLRSPSS